MTVGQRIKERRKSLGMNMDDMAEATGISRATLYRYESGDIKKFSTESLYPVARALKTTPQYLMGWTDDPHKTFGDEKSQQDKYYLNDETAKVAQAIFDDTDLHALFDAAQDSKPEDLKMAADLLRRLKSTNSDG